MYSSITDTFVSIATSSDANHSPENMIDGLASTFWTTTGTFPQEFVLSFKSARDVGVVRLETVNVKTLKLETCKNTEPVDFKDNCSQACDDDTAGVPQTFELNVARCQDAMHLRFTIQDAYDHFCCVRSVEVR